MGNYQAKKLAAQQHNDAIDYRKWLINNTVGQRRQLPVSTRHMWGRHVGFLDFATTLAYVGGFGQMNPRGR